MASEYQLTEDQLAEFSEDLSQEDNTTIILQDGQANVLDAMTVEGGVIDDATAPAPEPQIASKESCLNPNAEEFVSDAVLDTTLVIKNKQDSDEKCVKCSRKVCNGLRCSSCKEAWHWGCSAVTKDVQESIAFAQEGKWECLICRSDKNCQVCKIKIKEVHNLKKNVIELEEEISKLRSDLKIVCERNTDVEDHLTRERNLRKRVEKDLIQLQEELSESDCSSSDDSSNDGYCSDNEIQSKTKGKSSKHSQGGGSKKNTASKKTHRNQSNVSSDDECVSEVERKSNPNKNSSSGKHQKEELRQGNTVTLRKTQRNHPEAEKDSKKKDPVAKRQLVEQADCSSVKQKSTPIAENEQRSRSPHGKAVEYLEMYCGKEDGDDSVDSWDKDEGDDHRNKIYECNERWKMPLGRMDDHCYEFQNTGSCTKRNCKFLHIDIYTSYPKYGRDLNEHHKEKGRNRRSMKVSNSARPRSSHSIKTSRPNICYNFRDNGYCSFGSRCKFNHISICYSYRDKGYCKYGEKCKFSHENRNFNHNLR